MPPASRAAVLHIFSGDLWAGAEVMVLHLLSHLVKDQAIEITALSMNEGDLTRRLREAGVETHAIPESEHSFPAIYHRARRLLRGRRIDVIHSHRYKENLLACLLSRSMGKPRLVTTVHGLPEQGVNGGRRSGWTNRLNYFLLRRYFHRVVAVSHEIEEVLARRYRLRPEKVVVIHNGIPLPQSAAGKRTSREGIHIGTVGRLVPVKDYALFLGVASAVCSRSSRIRFSILGDGPLREPLARKAAELGLDGVLEFLPPRPDPWAYYGSLDIYLNTSVHEGVPLSVLEAMACEKPVVAPRVGGIPEVISHGCEGLLVEGRDPGEFARACLELIGDPGLRTEMGQRALEAVRARFSAARMAEGYREIYQRPRGGS